MKRTVLMLLWIHGVVSADVAKPEIYQDIREPYQQSYIRFGGTRGFCGSVKIVTNELRDVKLIGNKKEISWL